MNWFLKSTMEGLCVELWQPDGTNNKDLEGFK